jgi:hypothetical protein
MAAGNFDASAMNVAQVQLSQIFADPNVARTEMQRGEAATARALLGRQTASSVPILTSDKCVGADVYFHRTNVADVLSQVSGLSVCAVPTATEGESVKITLTTSVLAAASGKLKDNRCSNLVDFQMEFADTQRVIMAENRRILNRDKIITDISAAAQQNLDTFIDGGWDDTLPRIIVPIEHFSYDNLNEFRIVAKNNGFGDFFFLSGRLFNDDKWLAMLNNTNEGLRMQALAWAQREIYFDERDLDQVMTKKTAFAVDANSYIFWNTFRSSNVVTLVDTANQRYQWAVADPFLTWMDNGVEKPVMHEFEMVKACTARDAQGFAQYTYTMWGRILGGFEFAPEGPNSETGVLEFGDEAI